MLTWNLYNQHGQLIKSWPANEKEPNMTINEFAVQVSKLEGKAKQLSIAQIKEVLKASNVLLQGDLYRLIKSDNIEVVRA
jgi:hypothetical protein